jgi:crotonobetainyl-CoA:carnitine CoA-transferase CaiB-like acyl-CoA transferase
METPEQMAALKVQLQALMASQPYAYWLALFERIEVCAEPVRTTAEALALPHFVARGTVIQVPRPAGGEVAQLANPVRLSASSAQPGPSAPLPGWHTREVLFDLGLTSAQVDALCQSGAALDGRSE